MCVKSESKLYMCANDEWQVAATGEVFGGVGGTIILRSVGTTAGSNPSLEQTVSTNIDGVRLSCGNALYKSSYNPRPERAPGAQCRNVWVLDGSIHLFRENRM